MTSAEATRAGTLPAASPLELDGLELLPCGCVIAIQHARPWPVTVVSLEAKGPHCPLGWHNAGTVLRMGDPVDLLQELAEDDLADEVVADR